MKAYGGVDVQIHIFLISTVAGGEWSASRPGRFTSGESAPGTDWIGGWADPRAGPNDMEKRKFLALPGLELRSLGRPVHNQSLYRLRYPGSSVIHKLLNNLRRKLTLWTWIIFSHQWLYSLLLGPGLFFSFVIFFTQTVGLLRRVISPSQGRYLHTE
jgi:hypothetical protein